MNNDTPNSTYDSTFLIDRIYSTLDVQETKHTKQTLHEIVTKYEKPKTCLYKFDSICKSINRDIQLVKTFFETEMLTLTSLDGDNNLLITGRYDATKIKVILKNYIDNFVRCNECRHLNTKLEKVSKLTFVKCNDCMSSRVVMK